MIDLSITIVNYNTKNLLKNCIKSIYETTKNISFEIIVVDNASSDGSIEMLKTEFPDVKIIANQENRFFARAHNQALKISQGKYLMILNSDTLILDNAFAKMVEFMDENPQCGAVGPKFLNKDFTVQSIGHRFPTFIYGLFQLCFINTIFPNNPVRKKRFYEDINNINSPIEIDATGGACMLVRKEVVNKVGLLDENFLIYWEETDWCYRIHKDKWKIFYLCFAEVIHLGGEATMKKTTKLSLFFEKTFYNSMLYYYKKHYGILCMLFFKLILNFYTKPLLKVYRFIKSIF